MDSDFDGSDIDPDNLLTLSDIGSDFDEDDYMDEKSLKRPNEDDDSCSNSNKRNGKHYNITKFLN